MSELTTKLEEIKNQIRCCKCNKLLALHLPNEHVEIKCARCDTLNRIVEGMGDQLLVTDPDGKILFVNRASEVATGFDSNESIGKKPSELWGHNMSPEFYKDMWKTIKDDKKTFRGKMNNVKKTGEPYNVELIISPVIDSGGAVLFYVGISIAEKKVISKTV